MAAEEENHTVFIGGLSPETTQSDIHDAFQCCGLIRFIKIMTDKHTGRPRGFAFLTFDDHQEAEDAIMNLNGMSLHGNVLTINKAQNNMSGSDSGFYYRGYKSCYNCGSHGHLYRECPDLDDDENGDSDTDSDEDDCRVGACYNCGELGHFARECNIQGMNPTPAEAAALLRQANSSLKETAVTAPQVKGCNGGRLCPVQSEAAPPVRSVNPKSKETSDKLPLQVDSGKMAGLEVPPQVGSGKEDAKVPPQVGSLKKAGPADAGIFTDEDSEDMVLKITNTSTIKGFPVPNEFVALYNTIYEKHGHIATKTVIKNSMTALFGLVVDLLVVITEMKETSHVDLTAPLLKHWMSKISTAEAVKFNVGWLRTIVEEIQKYNVVYQALHLVVESDVEKHKKIQEGFAAATASKEALKVKYLAAEKHAAEVEIKLKESEILIKTQLEAKERIIARQRLSVLTDLL